MALHLNHYVSCGPFLEKELFSKYCEATSYRYASKRTIYGTSVYANDLRTTLDILKLHRARQYEMRLKAGSAWRHCDLVCCTRQGSALDPRNVRRQFHRLLEKAGLPPMPFHDLRHSAASLLISLGINPKVVQEILGHRSLAMTNVYSHVLPSMQKEAAEKMNSLFQKRS